MILRALLSFWLLLFTGQVMSTEEPKYDITNSFEKFELRAYEPMIIAETYVEGDMDEATRSGFKLIADYIFGNNLSNSGTNQNIDMTVPVTIKSNSEKISMTAPVGVQESGDSWRVHFVMPSQYTLDTLPKPNNNAVALRQIPSQNFAVIRFSGFTSEEKKSKKTAELLAWLATKKIRPLGTPQLARYNPPWTLPFLRRNEILIAY